MSIPAESITNCDTKKFFNRAPFFARLLCFRWKFTHCDVIVQYVWYYQQTTLFTVSSWLIFTTITKQVIQLINSVLVVTDYSWRYYLCSTSIPNRSLIDMWSYVSVYSWQVRFRFWVLYSSFMPKCRDYLFYLFISVRLLSVLRRHSVFHPRHNGQWAPTSKDFLSQILSITFIFLS